MVTQLGTAEGVVEEMLSKVMDRGATQRFYVSICSSQERYEGGW